MILSQNNRTPIKVTLINKYCYDIAKEIEILPVKYSIFPDVPS